MLILLRHQTDYFYHFLVVFFYVERGKNAYSKVMISTLGISQLYYRSHYYKLISFFKKNYFKSEPDMKARTYLQLCAIAILLALLCVCSIGRQTCCSTVTEPQIWKKLL